MATTLGCGSEYQALLMPVGGVDASDAIDELVNWTQIQWGRVLDDTSQASVMFEASGECLAQIRTVKKWANEILIVRDGDPVWQGPVVTRKFSQEKPSLSARDLSAWLDHRLVHNDYALTDIDIATIYQTIWDDAIGVDNRMRMNLEVSEAGVLGTLNVNAVDYRQAGPLLRDFVNAGIDWTVIVREFVAGGFAIPTAVLGPFFLEHFTNLPDITDDGTKQATRMVVTGQGGGAAGNTIVGDAVDEHSREQYGLLESLVSVTSYEDLNSAASAADSRLQIVKAGDTIVENAILSPDAPFTIDQLIPGAVSDLELDPYPATGQDWRLQSVTVTASGDGDERVIVVFQPIGANSV